MFFACLLEEVIDNEGCDFIGQLVINAGQYLYGEAITWSH